MSIGGATCRLPAPLLGQHSAEVFSKLGCSATEFDSLRERGII
jgi:crotonobetainyl-CoA:carnitine CoA-transferase CaiB-like acyl-CoA transferase